MLARTDGGRGRARIRSLVALVGDATPGLATSTKVQRGQVLNESAWNGWARAGERREAGRGGAHRTSRMTTLGLSWPKVAM